MNVQPADVSGVLERAFQLLTDDAEHDQPEEAAPPAQISIDVADLHLPTVARAAWLAISNSNDPPEYFRHGGLFTQIDTGDDGRPVLDVVNEDRARHILAKVAFWYREKGNPPVPVAALPPTHVVKDVLAVRPQLPLLRRVVEVPVFDASGRIQTTPGYHAQSHTFYAPRDGFEIKTIPERPNALEVQRAREIIVNDLLGDFPFAGQAECAHAVAALLLPFVRDLIDGPTPLHLIEKPTPGTGASLLADMLMAPALGRPVPTMTEGRDEDEWRKRITAKLRGNPTAVLLDNLRRRLDSAAVSSALTASVWNDRILGVSRDAELPVECVWMATGNNPALSNEIARRVVRIRLDAKQDQPWLRSGFRHPHLREWAREHRADLVWAALVLGRAWFAANRPPGQTVLGMYESWAKVLGGILGVVGVEGFLGNLQEVYERSDAEGAALRGFIAAWWDTHKGAKVGVTQLVAVATKADAGLDLGDGTERSQRTRLGVLLGSLRDRHFHLEREKPQEPLSLRVTYCGQARKGTKLWQLVAVPARDTEKVMRGPAGHADDLPASSDSAETPHDLGGDVHDLVHDLGADFAKGHANGRTPASSDAGPALPRMTFSGTPAREDGRWKRCQVCGGELPEHLERIGLHMWCTLPTSELDL